MKKFLSIVSIFSLTTTGATTLVACTKVGDSKDESNNSESNNDLAKIKIIEAPKEMTVIDPIELQKLRLK
ncbi:lipoprotein [Spiroplasma endosymbiont of Seladonia tumulorum]|uniref:lipoprotein n=1 Tax=Spiroplasma endosymbiont of Seladonia tumulorum TaxID=3066321 RepID=UPI0030D61664